MADHRARSAVNMTDQAKHDRLLASSLREFKWILVIWLALFVWVIGVCYSYGYDSEADIAMVLGMPAWVFWGVFVPWIAAAVTSSWFALTQMEDHPLEQVNSERDDGQETTDE